MTIDNERLTDERIAQIYSIPLWAVKASRMPDRADVQRQQWHDQAVRLGVNPEVYIAIRGKDSER